MNYSMYVAVDCIGLVILFLMYTNFGILDLKTNSYCDKLFDTLIAVNAALIISDMLSWLINGSSIPGGRIINQIITSVYYILHPVICLIWLVYCENILKEDTGKIIKKLPLYIIPAVVTIVLTLMSCTTNFFFWIDDNNLYHRGKYFILFAFMTYSYYVYNVVITVMAIRKNPRTEYKKKYKTLLFYSLFPFVGAVVQSHFYGINIIWICCVISLLTNFFHIQNNKITKDTLTGVNNRRCFESYFDYKLANRKLSYTFLLMIDLDQFKDINDKFGHLIGDEALKNTASLLIASIKRSDFIARIGGDEFVIAGERNNRQEVFETKNEIQHQIDLFNQEENEPYKLSLSTGCCIVYKEENKTIEEIIEAADTMMYNEKQLHHSLQNRT